MLTIECGSDVSIDCLPMLKYSVTNDKNSLVKINNTVNENIWPEQIVFPLTTKEKPYSAGIDKLNQFKPGYLKGDVSASTGFLPMSLVLYTADSSSQQTLNFDLIAFL